MYLLLRWIICAAALYLTVLLGKHLSLGLFIEPGAQGLAPALLAVLALGIANAVLRPLVQLFTLPLSCVTFGLFAFVVNALMFWLVGHVVPGFHVEGFAAALFGSVVMSAVSGMLNLFVARRRKRG